MSIRDLSLKELWVRAQQQLGGRSAQLKTRQELIDALEAHEAKALRRAPKSIPPLAPPLPVTAPEPPRQLPPDPMIWTGHSPLPKITAVPVVVSSFFAPSEAAGEALRLGSAQAYEDDRVLTFVRDPQTVYAAWDFSGARFADGAADGLVIDVRGITIQSFSVGSAAGGAFVGQLPHGLELKVEVRRGPTLLGESGWVRLGSGPGSGGASSSVVSASSSVG